MYGVGVEVEE